MAEFPIAMLYLWAVLFCHSFSIGEFCVVILYLFWECSVLPFGICGTVLSCKFVSIGQFCVAIFVSMGQFCVAILFYGTVLCCHSVSGDSFVLPLCPILHFCVILFLGQFWFPFFILGLVLPFCTYGTGLCWHLVSVWPLCIASLYRWSCHFVTMGSFVLPFCSDNSVSQFCL